MVTIQHRIEKDLMILSIQGELKQDSYEQIHDQLNALIHKNRIRGMVINFKNIQFIDSLGIGMMIQLFRDLKKQEIELALCHLNDTFSQYFSQSLIDTIIHIHSTEKDAIASFD